MLIDRICAVVRWTWRPLMRLAKDLLGCTSNLLRLLGRATLLRFMRQTRCVCNGWRLTGRSCAIVRWAWRPMMRLAKDLPRGTSNLFRLLARAALTKLLCRDLARVQWLAVNYSHLRYCALARVHDGAAGEGPARGYV